jgi:hypothetical protein
VRCGREPILPPGQDPLGRLPRKHVLGVGERHVHRHELEGHGRDHAEIAAAAPAGGPEEVLILALAGAKKLAVGGHDLDLHQAVAREPVAARQKAQSTARHEAGDPDGGTGSTGDRLPMRPERAIRGKHGGACRERRPLGPGIDDGAGHPAEIDDQGAVPARIPGEAVSPVPGHQTQTVPAGEVDRGPHVPRVGDLGNRQRPAVEAAVPDQPRGAISRATAKDQPPSERPCEIPEIAHRRGRGVAPSTRSQQPGRREAPGDQRTALHQVSACERPHQDSMRMVTGPWLTSSTAMRAPNLPRRAPNRSQNRS